MKNPNEIRIVIRKPIEDPKGFDLKSGWKGQMPDGRWLVFETEDEYKRIFFEELEEIHKK